MGALIDITGKRFAHLVAIRRAGISSDRKASWLFACDCGKEAVISGHAVRTGNTKSCGWCFYRHGMTDTPTYFTWLAMRTRCSNPNVWDYKYYGGRGIGICERWNDFRNFYADMGERPDGLTLDRIDVNGDYEPNNCRWATWQEQCANKRAKVAA